MRLVLPAGWVTIPRPSPPHPPTARLWGPLLSGQICQGRGRWVPWTDPRESPCPNASPGFASERPCPVASLSRSSHPTASTLPAAPLCVRPSQVRCRRRKDYGPSAPPPNPPRGSLAGLGTPRRRVKGWPFNPPDPHPEHLPSRHPRHFRQLAAAGSPGGPAGTWAAARPGSGRWNSCDFPPPPIPTLRSWRSRRRERWAPRAPVNH